MFFLSCNKVNVLTLEAVKLQSYRNRRMHSWMRWDRLAVREIVVLSVHRLERHSNEWLSLREKKNQFLVLSWGDDGSVSQCCPTLQCWLQQARSDGYQEGFYSLSLSALLFSALHSLHRPHDIKWDCKDRTNCPGKKPFLGSGCLFLLKEIYCNLS